MSQGQAWARLSQRTAEAGSLGIPSMRAQSPPVPTGTHPKTQGCDGGFIMALSSFITSITAESVLTVCTAAAARNGPA